MAARLRILVSEADFDPGAELAALEALPGGAVASFTGLVREDDGLAALHLDHYPGMTQTRMAEIAQDARARWPLLGITIIHRHGTMAVGERIVFVGTASSHRTAALESCAFLIDWLKVSAPFWKQAIGRDGARAWIEALHEDDARAQGWGDDLSSPPL